jgi:hypothetical protein
LIRLGAILAYNGKSVEAVGVAAAVTGLIDVIKLPGPRNVTIDNPAGDPVPTAEARP